ncbi:hypothetical protein [Roseomonas sp. AR75]|uniref:hypothetical protein n=1 Tax=Roseomonas sp. AR75 TaxID=2562311 RepID=UPI001F0F805E|nr:hypothetical protein [Roseomonas sp. AR75]
MLKGDELRSTLEAMPLLADGLPRELGVSIGELCEFGSENMGGVVSPLRAQCRAARQVLHQIGIGDDRDHAACALARHYSRCILPLRDR